MEELLTLLQTLERANVTMERQLQDQASQHTKEIEEYKTQQRFLLRKVVSLTAKTGSLEEQLVMGARARAELQNHIRTLEDTTAAIELVTKSKGVAKFATEKAEEAERIDVYTQQQTDLDLVRPSSSWPTFAKMVLCYTLMALTLIDVQAVKKFESLIIAPLLALHRSYGIHDSPGWSLAVLVAALIAPFSSALFDFPTKVLRCWEGRSLRVGIVHIKLPKLVLPIEIRTTVNDMIGIPLVLLNAVAVGYLCGSMLL